MRSKARSGSDTHELIVTLHAEVFSDFLEGKCEPLWRCKDVIFKLYIMR